MQTLGLIGGTSWMSTVDYYKLINQGVNEKLGGLNFSQCVVYSFNYADVKKNIDLDNWENIFQMVMQACNYLKSSGATGIVFCANTMHIIADRVERILGLPIIHIADATADGIEKSGLKKVGLLGTKFTMELDFFKSRLIDRSIEVMVPKQSDREFVNTSIFDELMKGIVTKKTKQRYLAIVDELIAEGAEGIILGCTEIPLVIKTGDIQVATFDTLILHSRAAVEFALRQGNHTPRLPYGE